MNDVSEQRKRAGERRMDEIAACMTRAALRPAEAPNSGFPLELHYRATLAARDLKPLDLNVPLERPTVRASHSANPEPK